MGLEFVLSRDQSKEIADLIREIFNPAKSLGTPATKPMDQLNEEELLAMFELYESGEMIYYLDPNTVAQINAFLETQSVPQIMARYDSEELNKNGIYPEGWTTGFSPDRAFNALHLTEDLTELKSLFEAADLEHDFVLAYVG